MSAHAAEVASGERFRFGENWRRFLEQLDEGRILAAENSLRDMLESGRLDPLSFLDIGSGSGLFSLAARRLGAQVLSFDYDPQSVACTSELRRRYFPEDPGWQVEEGSALDEAYTGRLGRFDIVYSWGVLHHTGAMWQAIGNATRLVAPGGRLFIAIYNDQGKTSARWRTVKRLYNRSPAPVRWLLLAASFLRLNGGALFRGTLRGRPLEAFRSCRLRGMSVWSDLVDWVGGYPFEVASPAAIFDFCRARGFTLERMTTTHTLGCNQFVFRQPAR